VHLGASDGSVAEARARLGPAAIVGATCGNSLERARAAAAAGADYVAFGRFFASKTKPDAPPAELATLTAARRELPLAICAIGGITPGNAAAVLAAGADLLAAVDGVFGAADVAAAARAYVSAVPSALPGGRPEADTRIP
ncbi:MAG: thiamine phosphate synthase, partial [Solimonas sp.]